MIFNQEFNSNVQKNSGGALNFNYLSNSVLESIYVVNNTNILKTGGGFFIDYSRNLYLKSIHVEENLAANGGGFAVKLINFNNINLIISFYINLGFKFEKCDYI